MICVSTFADGIEKTNSPTLAFKTQNVSHSIFFVVVLTKNLTVTSWKTFWKHYYSKVECGTFYVSNAKVGEFFFLIWIISSPQVETQKTFSCRNIFKSFTASFDVLHFQCSCCSEVFRKKCLEKVWGGPFYNLNKKIPSKKRVQPEHKDCLSQGERQIVCLCLYCIIGSKNFLQFTKLTAYKVFLKLKYLSN